MSNHGTYNQLASQTGILRGLNSSISTLNTHNDQVETKLQDVADKIGVDTSDSPLSLTALLRNQKDLIDNKLGQISGFLDKDSGAQFHNAQIHTKLDTANSHKADHTTHLTDIKTNQTNGNHVVKLKGSDSSDIHGDGSGNLKVNVINSMNINPANSNNGDHAGFNNQSVSTMLRARSNIADNTTGTFLNCNTSGHLNTQVVNSVNTEIHGHTDISDTNSSVRLLANSLGELVVDIAPTKYENVTLGNPSNILALTGGDTIDMNGFRNIFISCVINATTGGTCNPIFLLGSNDNSTFVITADNFQPTEARSSGVYEAGAVFGGLGFRYLKLASNNGIFSPSVSSVVVKTNRFNGTI